MNIRPKNQGIGIFMMFGASGHKQGPWLCNDFLMLSNDLLMSALCLSFQWFLQCVSITLQ
jgi:hypothetical protein